MKTIKTIILALFLGGCVYSLNAQLKIHSNGTVDIGNTTTPIVKINPNNNLGAIRIGYTDDPLFDNSTYFDMITPNGGVVIRERINGYIPGVTYVGFRFIRTLSHANPEDNYMVLTGLYNNGASIGTYSNSIKEIYCSDIINTGGFIGVLSSSDSKLKTNIQKLPSIYEKVLKLNPTTYDFVKSGSGKEVSKNSLYKGRTGFIAQEVKEIFPDLVIMGGDSLLRLDYAGLIPYLTKAIQEQSEIILKQNEKIGNLENQINDIQNGVYTADFVIDGEETQPSKAPKAAQQNETDNILYQNAPNPFNISTTIKYQLSDNATNAKICIYNLTGKQLQCYNLQATKGESSIEIRSSSLQSGMYLYSLIVDDKLIATKRMILTE
jgi:hypothetical protein